jgi:quercetin dioxygenase-like cupin family protein
MAKAGQVIHNPRSGETFKFIKTAADTDGECLQFEFIVSPGGAVPFPHVHVNQEETFHITQGKATFIINGQKREIGPGETIVVPRDTDHICINDNREEMRSIVTFTPALDLEYVFETFCGMAQDGKCSKKGEPLFMQLMLVLTGFEIKGYRTDMPLLLQKVMPPLLAPLARMLGYRAIYRKYSGFER